MDKNQKSRANNLVTAYRQTDRKYNLGVGDLTAKWVVDNIFTKSCAHCGETDWHKLGCNRLDNSKPHTIDNVEPCCMKCNRKLPRPNARRQKDNAFLIKLKCSIGIYNSIIEAYV